MLIFLDQCVCGLRPNSTLDGWWQTGPQGLQKSVMHLPNPRISCLPAKVPLIMSKIPSLSECWVHAHHFVHIILLILPNNSLGQELLLYHVTEEETGLLTCTKSHSELAPDHKPHSPPANSQC